MHRNASLRFPAVRGPFMTRGLVARAAPFCVASLRSSESLVRQNFLRPFFMLKIGMWCQKFSPLMMDERPFLGVGLLLWAYKVKH